MRQFSSRYFGILVPLLPLTKFSFTVSHAAISFCLGESIQYVSTKIYTLKLISQPRHIIFGFAYILPRSLKVLRRQNSEQARPKTKQEGKQSSDP